MSDRTRKEKSELENIVAEADALYDLMEQCKLGEKWKHDSERFMAFTAGHTRNLVKHSITLTKLTWLLIGLTIVHIFLILSYTFKWF